MEKEHATRLVVKGKKHIIISGTGNFFNGKEKKIQDPDMLYERVKYLEDVIDKGRHLSIIELTQMVKLLEQTIEGKNKELKEKERLICVLMNKYNKNGKAENRTK